jgi:hypothetical protein
MSGLITVIFDDDVRENYSNCSELKGVTRPVKEILWTIPSITKSKVFDDNASEVVNSDNYTPFFLDNISIHFNHNLS